MGNEKLLDSIKKKIENNPNYTNAMWHSCKKDEAFVWSLNQYIAKHTDEGVDSREYIGSELSVDYDMYKYGNIYDEKVQINIVCIVSELIGKLPNVINGCECAIPVPSNDNNKRLCQVVRKVAKNLQLDFCDTLTNTHKTKMKNVNMSKRKDEGDFISGNEEIKKFKKVLLIDDFVESGVTFRECVKALKKVNPQIEIVKIAIFRTEKTQPELE